MSNPDAAQPKQPREDALSDDISADELAALAGLVEEQQASPKLSSEISSDELAAILGTTPAAVTNAGKKPSTPTPAAPVAAPAVSTNPPAATAPAYPGLTPAESHVETQFVDNGIGLLMDVPLRVSVELGRISMTVQEVLALGRGSVIELERLAGEPVDILVNEKVIGRGEVVVVDDYFAIKITELIEPKA